MATKNLYQFFISEDDDVALFIYARDGEPLNPKLHINRDEKVIGVERGPQDRFVLNIADDVLFEHLQNKQQVLIGEVIPAEGKDEVEIIRTYMAALAN